MQRNTDGERCRYRARDTGERHRKGPAESWIKMERGRDRERNTQTHTERGRETTEELYIQ